MCKYFVKLSSCTFHGVSFKKLECITFMVTFLNIHGFQKANGLPVLELSGSDYNIIYQHLQSNIQ